MRLLILFVILLAITPSSAGTDRAFISCTEENDLYQAMKRGGAGIDRRESPMVAAREAPRGATLLVLADQYPTQRVKLDQEFFELVAAKKLRLYLECPATVPGVELGELRGVTWERAVVAREGLGLEKFRILGAHDLQIIQTKNVAPLLTLARVAGYDTAIYGLPTQHAPLLVEMHEGRWLIATTKLSGFVTGRFAPQRQWKTLWEAILKRFGQTISLKIEPTVVPSYQQNDPLPADVERTALTRAAKWYRQSRLLVHPSQLDRITQLSRSGVESTALPAASDPAGDGTLGILEGYASRIHPDGTQPQRPILRADCQAETAMVLAMVDQPDSARVATNLLNYLYSTSGMCGGKRGDPTHPSFGLIAWGALSPTWEIANYGDDNARTLLATLAAAATLKSDRWDDPVATASTSPSSSRTAGGITTTPRRSTMRRISRAACGRAICGLTRERETKSF
jgi:hypothetical protein